MLNLSPLGLDLYTDFPFTDLANQDAFVLGAELAGYSGVWAAENRHDPFLPVAAAANRRRRATIGTGVVALLSRNPFNTAQMAWDLHYNSGEKFILGVGTQTDSHLTGRLGIGADEKYSRLSECVGLIREIWSSWIEERNPYFSGRYYSINICPDGYRPTTRLKSVPKVYLMCSTLDDVKIAAEFADGVFTHPVWTSGYIEHVLRELPIGFPVIDGSIISTGLTQPEIEKSRIHARWRIMGYWQRSNYDDVYSVMGIMDDISRFRRETTQQVPWPSASYIDDMFRLFVCDASIRELPGALRRRRSTRVTGLFPNIMSLIPRILPSDVVSNIRRGE